MEHKDAQRIYIKMIERQIKFQVQRAMRAKTLLGRSSARGELRGLRKARDIVRATDIIELRVEGLKYGTGKEGEE